MLFKSLAVIFRAGATPEAVPCPAVASEGTASGIGLECAKAFLADEHELNTDRKAHLLALEIQQCIEDEIMFMRKIPELYL